jgi:MFS family permease
MRPPESVMQSVRAFAEVFANPRVRTIQIAGIGSTLGTWAYAVALPVYAYREGGAKAVGLLFFARFVLAAAAAPWLGIVADRWSRRQLMLSADAIRFAIFCVITAIVAFGGPGWPVFVLAVSSTIVSGSYGPAQAALMPSLVDSPEELTAANLVGNTVSSVGMFAGPAVGGVLLALSGPAAVFALNAALFAWSGLWVLKIARDEPPGAGREARVLQDLAQGIATITRHSALRVIVGLTAAQTAVVGAFEVLLVVLALRLLHAGNAGVGWLNTAQGAGTMVGALVVAVFAQRRRLAGGLGVGAFLWGVPIALSALWLSLPVALALVAVVGVGDVLVEVTGTTLLQRSAENEVLGRVFGVLQSLVLGGLALGSIVAPAIVSLLGPRWALVATGAFLPVLLVPLWPKLRAIDAAGRVAEEPLRLLRGSSIFASLPQPVAERLAAGAGAVAVAAGDTVFRQGEPGDRFYVIAAGQAEVVVGGGTARELGPGDFFGEIALLRDVPRTATVRALDELRLYAIERDDFIAAVTGHAPSLEAAESVVAARLPAGAVL